MDDSGCSRNRRALYLDLLAAMTIRVLCDGDGCDKTIDRDAGGWFGVDYQLPPVEAEPDEDGTVILTEVVGFNQDHEFHFHNVDCLVSWAFARSFTPQPEGTPHE